MTNEPINVFWFRRDFRLEDNNGLYQALKKGLPVLPIFIFDANILEELDKPIDRRVQFIYEEIVRINEQLGQYGSSIVVKYGKPTEIWAELFKQHHIENIYANRDYEPYATERDAAVNKIAQQNNSELLLFKDHVIFEWNEVLKDDGKPYTVYTPYSKKWKLRYAKEGINQYPTENHFNNFVKLKKQNIIALEAMGFKKVPFQFPDRSFSNQIIGNYDKTRNFPAVNGTSRLGLHLRFGTISIRALAKFAINTNEKYLNELIWRDFYQVILKHFPHVVTSSFKPKYDAIPWRNNEADFEKWATGNTGYPMVDAGMRELVTTGYMHNRVRMVVASFFTKHLLLDWRRGEAFFAKHLLDFDLASNNGGWQWAAGTGCDAAPYFRIFNPTTQITKFDKEHKYINKWIPELTDPFKYAKPMVEHKFARERALATYKAALGG